MTETRFASPSLAVASHESNTSVYLAYYDDVQGQIRFRYGSVCPDSKDNFNNFVDNSGFGDLNNGDKRVFESNTSNFSLIAGADWQKYKTSSDTTNGYTKQVGSNWFYDTGYNAGQYVAIDVIAGSSASDDVLAVFVPLPFLEDSVRRTLARSVLTMSGFDNEYYFIFVLVHQIQ